MVRLLVVAQNQEGVTLEKYLGGLIQLCLPNDFRFVLFFVGFGGRACGLDLDLESRAVALRCSLRSAKRARRVTAAVEYSREME